MKDMNSTFKNNISELTKLARKFNCFYLSGMLDEICILIVKSLQFLYYCFDFNALFIISGLHQGICMPFLVAGHQVGLVRPDVIKHLQRFPEVSRIIYRMFIN